MINEGQVRYLFETGLNCREIAESIGEDANRIRRIVPRLYGKETVEEARFFVCSRLKAENEALKKRLDDHK